MGKGFAVIALVFMVFQPISFACDQFGLTGIVEENDLFIPVGLKGEGGITEEDFNSILDRIESLYEPVLDEMGKTLEVVRKWDDGTVNAYAQQMGNVWRISMFGGLARHDTITKDAFALVACHELGHHLGGAPKKASWWGTAWASNEGQSDFYGNSKCLRNFMKEDNNVQIVAEMEIDDFAKEKCNNIFTNENDVAMCMRGAMAGLSLGNLFRALRRLDTPLKFTTPDPARVTTTNHNHPAPQCRLDTYFAGSICDKEFTDDVSNSDPNVGFCNRVDGYDVQNGARPLCWFKPSGS